MTHATAAIRNLALVGDVGVGKTTLVENLLFTAGAIRQKGAVLKGTTVTDYDSLEKKLQHSLDVSLCHFDTGGVHVNLADAPGYGDFAGRTYAALRAVESVGIMVSASGGVGPMTRRLMGFAKDRGLCRFFIVNGIDRPEAKPEEVLKQLRDSFGKEVLPLNLPTEGGKSVVDCFFQLTGPATAFSSVEQAHKEIIEQVVEIDEELMVAYLDQGELSLEQLHGPFEKALREGHLVPVIFTSAETGVGVDDMLKFIARLAPNPAEGNPPKFLKGEGEAAKEIEVKPDPAKHVLAHVFKVLSDPFVGRLGYLRIYQGTLSSGGQVLVGDARKPVKLSRLYRIQGKERIEIDSAGPGDIVALAKIDELVYDVMVHDNHEEDDTRLAPVTLPVATLGLVIEPEKSKDEHKLSDSLHRAVSEDPCVRLEHVGRETVLYGLGELHLKVILDQMKERSDISVKTRVPTIPYRETISKKADGHHRHKKQTGGAGQFGEVYIRIEPLARGSGFEFEDAVVGGAVPSQYIPAVEKGVKRAIAEGAVAGFPIHDVKVTLYDGKYHAVDSKEVAFVAAGRKAMIEAVKKADPVVLEPVVRLESTVPMSAIGGVTGELSTRRGRITGQSPLGDGSVVVNALLPLAEVNDYVTRLKSITGGEGSVSAELSHYDPAPARKQQELAAAFRPVADEDD